MEFANKRRMLAWPYAKVFCFYTDHLVHQPANRFLSHARLWRCILTTEFYSLHHVSLIPGRLQRVARAEGLHGSDVPHYPAGESRARVWRACQGDGGDVGRGGGFAVSAEAAEGGRCSAQDGCHIPARRRMVPGKLQWVNRCWRKVCLFKVILQLGLQSDRELNLHQLSTYPFYTDGSFVSSV